MKVQIITSEFAPEPQVQSRMVLDVAIELASGGHQVQVVCPYPSRPTGVHYSAAEISAVTKLLSEKGINLTRVASYTTTQSRVWPRMRESWSFGRHAADVIVKSTGADIIYDVVWPMFSQAWVWLAARKQGIPRVSHIMDVYPEAAYPKVPRWLQISARRPLLALDRANARSAHKLVVISESMRKVYEGTRHVPSGRLEVVHTWQDEALFRELPEPGSAAVKYNLPTELFTFLYLGNIGPVAGVDHLIHSFARANLQDCQLVIVGEGTQKLKCMHLAEQVRANVVFLSDPDVANVPLLHSLAHVCLLPLKCGAASTSFPSKLCGYMLSGKPVLASVDEESDSASIVQKSGCGWVIRSEDIEAMSRAMRLVRSLELVELAAIGAKGKTYALDHLSKENGLKRLVSIILSTARDEASNPRPFQDNAAATRIDGKMGCLTEETCERREGL